MCRFRTKETQIAVDHEQILAATGSQCAALTSAVNTLKSTAVFAIPTYAKRRSLRGLNADAFTGVADVKANRPNVQI